MINSNSVHAYYMQTWYTKQRKCASITLANVQQRISSLCQYPIAQYANAQQRISFLCQYPIAQYANAQQRISLLCWYPIAQYANAQQRISLLCQYPIAQYANAQWRICQDQIVFILLIIKTTHDTNNTISNSVHAGNSWYQIAFISLSITIVHDTNNMILNSVSCAHCASIKINQIVFISKNDAAGKFLVVLNLF